MSKNDLASICEYLMQLQDRICQALEVEDQHANFIEKNLEGEKGALARPRTLSEGALFEKAAVNFTRAVGRTLPSTATLRRPELSGLPFTAASLSLITHPKNPYIPTSHMNLRCFIIETAGDKQAWWFGGGFDLTPFYGFEEDARHWHQNALKACMPFGSDLYPRLKSWCDEYFFLPHRDEARGVGGLFFDDFSEGSFENCFGLMRSVGDHYLEGYLPIVQRRKDLPWGDRERKFQLYRRGRYVEFNLVYDRGTLYGLQSGRRVESVLSSLPPVARWEVDYVPDPGSPESELSEKFLRPREWIIS